MRSSEREFSCHVCKTYGGEIAKALDYMVNQRKIFSSYASAVAQCVLDYYRRLVRDDLEISRLRAISKEVSEQT
jgi:hypothetical protein